MTPLSRRQALAAAVLATLASGPALGATTAEVGDMSLGNAKARVKVVEYASASCGHCAHFNDTIFPAFRKKYIDTGRVHYTLKELLTPPQQVAAAGFLLARCAGPDKYFKVLDEVFRSQSSWRNDNIKQVLVAIGQANGVTEAQFEACIADPRAIAALNARVERAASDGVESTPTFFVNGKKVAVATLADLDAAIAAAARPAGRR